MSPRKGLSRKRPFIKQGMILATLREQIISGEWKPSSQIPTREKLQHRFGVARTTLQRTLDQLTQDGFVYAKGKTGTFVAENPPHLASYALIFNCTPADRDWTRFQSALTSEAAELARTRPIRISGYHGVFDSSDSEDYQKLLHDVAARRLAGMIFATVPGSVIGPTLDENADMPRVAIMLPSPDWKIPVVYPDVRSFVDRALDDLLARGRRRVAIVGQRIWPKVDGLGDYFLAGVAKRNMECRPYWMHTADAQSTTPLVHLLMHSEQKTRPNGLIIADDNLVENATAGLVMAGVRVPEDVEVIAHCNFPWPVSSVLPVHRLGFDAQKVMAACLESIDAQRLGNRAREMVSVPAQFEQELVGSDRLQFAGQAGHFDQHVD